LLTETLKSQNPKHKYQINHNDQNSKSQFGSLKNWDLRFIWNLVLEIWDLNEFIFKKKMYNT